MHSDEFTIKQCKVGFARILIKVDVSQPVVKMTRVKIPGGPTIDQIFEYENLPEFCQQCQTIGHRCRPARNEQREVVQPPNMPAQEAPAPARRRRRRNRNQVPTEQWIQVGRRTDVQLQQNTDTLNVNTV
ncbi:hypothetical protein OROMI_002702 [Orobanche minor]